MDNLMELTGYELQDKLIESRIGVIPVGSIEYHGPHLPLGTDSLIATDLARRVADQLEAVLYPLVAYTGEFWTKGFQGTIPIEGKVFVDYMAEILRGVLGSGLGGVLMVGAHGENGIYCPEAGRMVADEFPHKRVMFLNWWYPLSNQVIVDELQLFPYDVIGEHGGVAEGSMVERIAPGSVDPTTAPDRERHIPWAPLECYGPTPNGPTDTYKGYWGHVKDIDGEKGEALLKESANRIVSLVREALKHKPGLHRQ